MFITTQYSFGGGAVGFTALNIAESKSALPFVPALTLGIMCNALVCLAVWMCYAARTTIDRVVTMVPPIAAFVASGFEHCIANVYFIPFGLFIKAGAPDSFWAAIKSSPAQFTNLTWGNFIVLQFDSGHDRKRDRRCCDGCGSLLVCLSAQEAGATGFERPQLAARWNGGQ